MVFMHGDVASDAALACVYDRDDENSSHAEDEDNAGIWELEIRRSKECAAQTQQLRSALPSHPTHITNHGGVEAVNIVSDCASRAPCNTHSGSLDVLSVSGLTRYVLDAEMDQDVELVIEDADLPSHVTKQDGNGNDEESDVGAQVPFLWPCSVLPDTHSHGGEGGYDYSFSYPLGAAVPTVLDEKTEASSDMATGAPDSTAAIDGTASKERCIAGESKCARKRQGGDDRRRLCVDRKADTKTSTDDETDSDMLEVERVLECARVAAHTSLSLSDSASADPFTSPTFARLLSEHLGVPHGRFRPHQDEVCWHVLCGRCTLVVCPTGWGKSLCYQFPMMLHRLHFRAELSRWQRRTNRSTEAVHETSKRLRHAQKSAHVRQNNDDAVHVDVAAAEMKPVRCEPVSQFCVVVSPLLSLMLDQAERMHSRGILRSVTLSGQTSAARMQAILAQLSSPLCAFDVVFVSPEKFTACGALQAVLSAQLHRVALFCIDEVHCVSRWAHDFRPTFMYIHRVVQDIVARSACGRCPSGQPRPRAPPFLCLTATATGPVLRQLQKRFAIEKTVVCDEARTHLQLQSVNMTRVNAKAKSFVMHNNPRDRECSSSSVVTATHTNITAPTSDHDGSRDDGDSNSESSFFAFEHSGVPTTRALQEAVWAAVQTLPSPTLVYVRSRDDADELAGYLTSKLHGGKATPQCANPATHARATASVFRRTSYSTSSAAVDKEDVQCHTGSTGTGTGCAATRVSECTSDARVHGPNGGGKVPIVRSYHAGLSSAVRTRTQRQFLRNEVDILVATVAFGMGIDKPNIRSVIHACIPNSVESYVQEVGRAGRDGAPSVCRLLYNPYDYYDLRNRLLASSWLSCHEVTQVVQSFLHQHRVTRGSPVGCAKQVKEQRCAIVSPAVVATQLEVAEEVVETLLFMMLAQSGEDDDDADETQCSRLDGSSSTDKRQSEIGETNRCESDWSGVFVGLCGTCPLGYRAVEVRTRHESSHRDHGTHRSASMDTNSYSSYARKHDRNGNHTNASHGSLADEYDGGLDLDDGARFGASTSHNSGVTGSGIQGMQWDACFALAPTHNDNYNATHDSSHTVDNSSILYSGSAVVAVSHVLSQLNVRDAVLERCRRPNTMYDLIEDANVLGLSLTELRERLVQLVRQGEVVLRRPRPTGYVVLLDGGSRYDNAMTPAGTEALGYWLWRRYDAHVRRQLDSLLGMMHVLRCPTHEKLRIALRDGHVLSKQSYNSHARTRKPSSASSPRAVLSSCATEAAEMRTKVFCAEESDALPPRSLTRVAAVSVANAFVAENRLRISSTQEVARALLGVVPRSVIKRGKFAGQLPLAQSWYVKSPYFGALREFDPYWVLSLFATHDLDAVCDIPL